MEIVRVETKATGSRVFLRLHKRQYMAAVKPDGEIVAVDVERLDPVWNAATGHSYFMCDRFSRGYPKRIIEAVRSRLAN